MKEILNIKGDKQSIYLGLIPQLESLIADEQYMIANMANISAALKTTFNWLWVGFYLVDQNELVLGPFQGPVACTRISKGKGVCGLAWQKGKTIVVPDVNLFSGHIACSSSSQSEIVIPVFKNGEIIAVLDADSEHINHFGKEDQQYLEMIVKMFQ